MFHQTTALEAEAQEICAEVSSKNNGVVGRISEQPSFTPIVRRELIGALATLGRDMGIRPATLAVLDAMMSFIACKDGSGRDGPVTPLHLLTIYAANDTIGFRARGLTDRQLRRHFEILERQGLMQRRDSSNGKRFPIYQGGKVVAAYGLDLSPLFARSAALMERAKELRLEQQETRGIVAQILQLRRVALEMVHPSYTQVFIENIRNITRRVNLSLIEAKKLLQKLQELTTDNELTIAHKNHTETTTLIEEKPACAGQNVRHKYQINTYLKKQSPKHICKGWHNYKMLSEYYPSEPRSELELYRILGMCAKMLGIGKALWERAIKCIHVLDLTHELDQILTNAKSIKDVNAFLSSIMKNYSLNK